MSSIKITGIDKLQMKLKKNVQMSDVKKVVRKNGSELQKKAQKNAPVGTPQSTGIPGYVGGTLKRSIGLDITDGGMTAEVEPLAEYGLSERDEQKGDCAGRWHQRCEKTHWPEIHGIRDHGWGCRSTGRAFGGCQ